MIKIIIDSQYHRKQFDDWLAGGKAEYKGKTYYWSAQNNNYGFGKFFTRKKQIYLPSISLSFTNIGRNIMTGYCLQKSIQVESV